jgi:hypothetical protein
MCEHEMKKVFNDCTTEVFAYHVMFSHLHEHLFV